MAVEITDSLDRSLENSTINRRKKNKNNEVYNGLISGLILLLLPGVDLTTELKAVKISKETYSELSAIAGELQIRRKRPVSMDEAMKYLIRKSRKGKKISDLAGSWSMNDTEAKEVKESIVKAWETWKP